MMMFSVKLSWIQNARIASIATTQTSVIHAGLRHASSNPTRQATMSATEFSTLSPA